MPASFPARPHSTATFPTALQLTKTSWRLLPGCKGNEPRPTPAATYRAADSEVAKRHWNRRGRGTLAHQVIAAAVARDACFVFGRAAAGKVAGVKGMGGRRVNAGTLTGHVAASGNHSWRTAAIQAKAGSAEAQLAKAGRPAHLQARPVKLGRHMKSEQQSSAAWEHPNLSLEMHCARQWVKGRHAALVGLDHASQVSDRLGKFHCLLSRSSRHRCRWVRAP